MKDLLSWLIGKWLNKMRVSCIKQCLCHYNVHNIMIYKCTVFKSSHTDTFAVNVTHNYLSIWVSYNSFIYPIILPFIHSSISIHPSIRPCCISIFQTLLYYFFQRWNSSWCWYKDYCFSCCRWSVRVCEYNHFVKFSRCNINYFRATTHSDLIIRAVEKNIQYQVIHNASIINAIGCCGLQVSIILITVWV